MTRPSEMPTFATDASITGGPGVGAATRLRPSNALLAQGFYQGRKPPARMISWLFGMLCDWSGYLAPRMDHDALRFTRTDLKVGTSSLTKLSTIIQTTNVGSVGVRQLQILASGTTTLPAPSFEMLNDGTAPAPIANFGSGTGGAPLSPPACNTFGTFFYGANGGGVYASSDGGSSSTAVTVTGLGSSADWVGFTLAHYLVWETSTSKLYRSTALAGTWANTVLAIDAVIDMCTDGAGRYILLGTSSGVPKVYLSTDDGVTWALQSLPGSGTTGVGDICYSINDRKFYLLVPDTITSTAKLFSAADGVTWTLAKTIVPLFSVVGGQHTFAAAGPVLACVVNRSVNAINKHPYGIAYSLDSGANWYEIYFGDPTGGNPISNLIGANGRLYAIDGWALYQSGQLETPAPTFTGL